jgi:hypothetical protein
VFSADMGGASAAASTCSVTAGGVSQAGACNAITVGGLRPSSGYDFTVTVSNPAGQISATGSQRTNDVTGIAACKNNPSSNDPAQHTWCNSSDNALEVQTSPAKLHSGVVGRTTDGVTYKAYCFTSGDDVYAYVYNHDKRSNLWVRIDFNGGQYYTPLAWFNVDGNAGSTYTGALPRC